MGLFSGSTKTETKSKPYNPWVTDQWTKQMWGLSQTPQQFYPEQTYAEMDPLQEEALGMREQYARGLGGMMAPGMEAWRSTLTAPDVANNPYVQGMLEQQRGQVMQGLQESMPALQANMLGVNERLGGTGQGVAEGIATRGAMDTLARQAAQTQFDAYQAGLGQQRYGLGAMPGMLQLGQMPADILSGVGATRRAEDQRAIDEDMARFDFEQQEPWRRLERFAAAYQPMTGSYGTTTAKNKGSPSILGAATQLGGLALGGLGAFGGLGQMLGGGGAAMAPAASSGILDYGTMGYNMPAQGYFDPYGMGFRGGAF